MARNDKEQNTEHRNQKQMHASYRGIDNVLGVETGRIIDNRNK